MVFRSRSCFLILFSNFLIFKKMKNIILTAFTVIFGLIIFSSCEKEIIAPTHGDLDYEYSPTTTYGDTIATITYGDSTSIVITTYGDTTVTINYGDTIFINNGTIITVGDSSIFVNGSYVNVEIGSVVYDYSTNTSYTFQGDYWIGDDNDFYYYDNSINTWVNIEVNNLCCSTCAAGDTINVADTTILIVPQNHKAVALLNVETSWFAKLVCSDGATFLSGGEGLFRSAMLWSPNANDATFGTYQVAYDSLLAEYVGTSLCRTADQTIDFTLNATSLSGVALTEQMSDCSAGMEGPIMQEEFSLNVTSAIPSAWEWNSDVRVKFAWWPGQYSTPTLYVAYTQGLHDWLVAMNAPSNMLTVDGWIPISEIDNVGNLNHFVDYGNNETATLISDYQYPQ